MKYFWSRFFARMIDYGIFYLVGILLSLSLPTEFSESFYFIYALATPLLWAPLEAILLSLWGTTLGKMVFGVVVRDIDGEKLSLGASFRRSFFLSRRPGVVYAPKMRGLGFLILTALAAACGSSLFFGKDISQAAIEYEEQEIRGNWLEYASEEGKFVVQFPKKPELETQTYPIPDSEQSLELSEVKAESREIYSVSYLEMPKKWRFFSDGTLLKGAINVVAKNTPGAEVVDKKRVTHKSHQALDFRMKQGENEIFGRLIIVGTTLYKLTVTYPPSSGEQDQHDAFLSSFELTSS